MAVFGSEVASVFEAVFLIVVAFVAVFGSEVALLLMAGVEVAFEWLAVFEVALLYSLLLAALCFQSY